MTAINLQLPDGAKPRALPRDRKAAPAVAPVPTPAPRVFEPLEGFPSAPVGNLASFNVVVAAPSAPVAPKSEYEVLDEFARAIQNAGMVPPVDLVADGKIHRFSPDGKGKDRSGAGWYVLHLDGVAAGSFGDWRMGEGSQKWCAKGESEMTQAEREQYRATMRAMGEARDAEKAQAQQEAAGLALQRWDAAAPAPVDHPYLARKGVEAYGIRAAGGALLVPMRDASGKLHGLQTIFADGAKRFPSGGKKRGCFHAIGEPSGALVVCEGYATGASIHEATGLPVAVAFDAGNLLPVAESLRAKYPALELVIAADDDWATPQGNKGKEEAQKAALATGATVVAPMFPAGRGEKDTDFNDLRQLAGLEAVRACFAGVVAGEEKPSADATTETSADAPAPAMDNSASVNEVPSDDEEPEEPAPGLVPELESRPQYLVFNDWHEEGGRKYRPGVWYFGVKSSRSGNAVVVVPVDAWICSPLHVEAITTDAHDGSYGRLLRFKSTRGNWKEWAMPMEMLRSDCADLRGALFSMGVEIDHHHKGQLPAYLQSKPPKKHLQCVTQTGWSDTTHRAFVLPDTVLGPRAAGVVYQSEERDGGEYRTGGTLVGWRDGVALPAIGNPMLVLALCTAFAGPLLAKVQGENGGVHFVGGSSIGKTTLLEAASSVWGSPDTYKRSWRTTSNGAEAVAALFNDALLTLDEIKEADPADVGAVVYMLGNGKGKQRASRAGGARAVARWRCSVVSTGEHTVETSMAMGGHRMQGGQRVRLLDVLAERQPGSVWDTLHGHSSGAALSIALKMAASKHYGHAGRAFVDRLSRDDTPLHEMLDGIQSVPGLARDGAGQVQRVARRFAVLAMAGELATMYGLTGWGQGEATRAAVAGLDAWCGNRGTPDGANIEAGQVVDAITAFIERHGSSRFSSATFHDQSRDVLIRDRAGYWRDVDNGGQRVYLFNSDGMKAALKGFDLNRALEVLREAGLIEGPGRDKQWTRRHRIDGHQSRFYEVWPDGVNGGNL